jgi:hypothetical protein
MISTTSSMTRTTVMLDCDFAIREIERRLVRFGTGRAARTGHHRHPSLFLKQDVQ